MPARGISASVLEKEGYTIEDWRRYTANWNEFTRLFARVVASKSYEERLEIAEGMTRQTRVEDEEYWQRAIDLTSLSDEAVEKLNKAIALNGIDGVYPDY